MARDELLTETEKVLQIIEQSGGKVRQKQIRTELGWKKNKTSHTLSLMEKVGEIHRVQIGREKHVSTEPFMDDPRP